MSSQRNRLQVVALWTIAMILVVFGSALPGGAQSGGASLVGTWRLTQCAGTPSEFFVLIAFNEGGTTFHSDMSSGVGGKGAGVWTKTRGAGDFAATAEEFQDDDVDGNADSRLRFRLTIHLSDRENFTGTVTADQLSLDGTTVMGTLGSCPVAGTRLRVIPE